MTIKALWQRARQGGQRTPRSVLRRQARLAERSMNAMKASDAHTHGRPATFKDADEAGMTVCREGGLPICTANGTVLCDNSDQPVHITGGPGTQKTMSCGFPMLAQWAGSSVVVDVDYQYARGVAAYRERLGHRSIFITADELYGFSATAFNPFDIAIAAFKEGKTFEGIERAQEIAFLLVPDSPEKKGSANEWIESEGRDIDWLSLVYLAKDRPAQCTPGGLYRFLMRPVQDILDEIGHNASEEFVLRRAIQLQAEVNAGADKQVQWKLQKARETLSRFEPGSPHDRATRYSEFDPAEAKSGGKPLDIYIMVSGTRLESDGTFISLMLSSIIERIADASGTRRTLVLADEFSQIPKSRVLIKCLRAYRKRLIRTVTMTQSRQATIDRYGATLAADIEAMAGTKIWLSPSYDIARELSAKSGTRTVLSRSMRDGNLQGNDLGVSVSDLSAPNLHVADIVFDGVNSRKSMIIESASLPGLLVTEKLGWWEIWPYAEQLSTDYLDDSNRHDRSGGSSGSGSAKP